IRRDTSSLMMDRTLDHLRIISGIAICNRRREAAAWARSVQAGSARVTGCVFEGLRHARPERAGIRAFRRRQGDDRRAAERGIELIKEMRAQREADAMTIEGKAEEVPEPQALPKP